MFLSKTSPGICGFGDQNTPISPSNGKALCSRHLASQNWSIVFGYLAGTFEDCQVILVSGYLMDNKGSLRILGYG